MDNFSIDYPAWFIGLCILLGVIVASILYFRDKQFDEMPKIGFSIMAIIRVLSVSIICFFLLNPLLKTLDKQVKNPIILVGTDHSESVAAFTDSLILSDFKNKLRSISSELGQDYQVEQIAFGDKINPTANFEFDQKLSNISSFISYADETYDGQNIGAIILASDGIYNAGVNPIYQPIHNLAPLYTIGLGDTTIRKDLAIRRVYHNDIAYLNDKFIVQIDWSAKNAIGSKSTINLYRIVGGESNLISKQDILVDENSSFNTTDFIIEAQSTGVQRYRIGINTISGEESRSNNYKDFFIDVMDGRQRVLIYANSPHPDIGALKRTLLNNENYEVDVMYAPDQEYDIRSYDLVILHQLPSAKFDISGLMNTLNQFKIARFFIIGERSNITRFNDIQSFLNITKQAGNANEVNGIVPINFSLFTLDDEFRGNVLKLPPLNAPFGEYAISPAAQIFMYQKIGNIQTEYPLLLFGEQDGIKTGILSGEGIWRWQLFNYLQWNDHRFTQSLLNKSIQYLSLKDDKRKFKVRPAKNIFNENDPVVLDGELYNDSYELINDPEVSLVIRNEEDQEFEFLLNRVQNFYTLNAGFFPEGNYTYRAEVSFNGALLQYNGRFTIQALDFELSEPTADHTLMRSLALNRNGKFYKTDQLEQLVVDLKSNSSVKPVMYQSVKNRSLIHLKWPFFLILLLLSTEWFLRRYYGSY